MQNQPTGYVDQAASHLLGPRGQLGWGGFGLALAILVKNGAAPHSYVFPVNHCSRPKAEAGLFYKPLEVSSIPPPLILFFVFEKGMFALVKTHV